MLQFKDNIRIEKGPCIVKAKCTDDLLRSLGGKYVVGGPDSYGKPIEKDKFMHYVDKLTQRYKVYLFVSNEELKKGKELVKDSHPDGGRYMPRGEFETLEEAKKFAKTLGAK